MDQTSQPERPGGLSPLKRALIALEEMEAKLQASERSARDPIAIVGIGCRYPGGADSPEAFWRVLRDGVDTVKEIPRDRWDVNAFHDPNPDAAGKMYTRWTACLDQVDRFEPQLFGIAPREAVHMDPQQRLILEVAWEALEHAGQAPDRLYNSATGVFLGLCATDYFLLQARRDLSSIDAYSMSGLAHSVAAGRLSYVLGLQGPSLAVDTACSSSLVAVHLACQSLRAGECTLAMAGGVHVLLSPENNIAYARTRMAAFDGRCKTFDASADGFVEGEGCGVVVLKRLSDAIQNGDRILAVIRGSAVNQDGPSSGLTAPNGPSQEAVIREALSKGGVAPAQIDYVEAHGTGTPLGDPIEVQALGAVLGEGRAADRPVVLGSVKTNIGHTQAAAGIAGLIKLVLALQHEEIPPHLHFKQPNPYIAWDRLPVRVGTGVTPWPSKEGGRFAGVSAFGFSGTNAHVVVGEAPRAEPPAPAVDRPLHVLTLSARTDTALAETARRLAADISRHPSRPIADVCYTANAGRARLPHRLSLVVESPQQAVAALAEAAERGEAPGVIAGRPQAGDRPKVAFLFTGQGSQYAGMGRLLYDTQPTFRRALDRCAAIADRALDRPLLDVIYPPAGEPSPLDQTAYTQPALFAIEFALAELWQSWGVEPSAVLGHSVGEYVAACVAGVLTLEDAMRLVTARGRLIQALPPGGAMTAILASEEDVLAAIGGDPRVSIAAVNAPDNVVISGERDAVRAIAARFDAAGVRTEPLVVSHAFHSALMEPMLDRFTEAARAVAGAPPRIAFASNVTGTLMRGAFATPGYWRQHVRGTVRFAQSVAALHEQGVTAFLEVGPKPTLSSLGSRCVPAGSSVFLPSLSRGRDDWRQMLATAGALFVNGVDLDWDGFERDYPRRARVALPTYPFERERYWLADTPPAGAGAAWAGAPADRHPLLQRRVRSASKDVQFESQVSAAAPALLEDHQVYGLVVFPAAAYLEAVAAAAAEVYPGRTCSVDEVEFSDALVLADGGSRVVQLVLTPDGGSEASWQFFSLKESAGAADLWRRHAAGRVRVSGAAPAAPAARSLEEIKGACVEPIDAAAYYEAMRRRGNDYGPRFRGLQRIWRRDGEAIARIELAAELAGEAAAFRVHPAVLDAAFQLLGAAVSRAEAASDRDDETFLPVSLERFRILAQPGTAVWAHVQTRAADQVGGQLLAGDIRLLDDDGRVLVEAEGLFLKRASRDALRRSLLPDGSDWIYETRWQPAESSAEETTLGDVAWLGLADRGGVGTQIAARLRAGGARVVTVSRDGSGEAATETERADPLRAEDFERVWSRGSSAGDSGVAWNVVHLWNLDAGTGEPASAANLEAACAAGCASLLHLCQAVAQTSERIRRVSLVTRGAQAVADGDDVAVAQAPAWGLSRSVALEYPDWQCTRIDLDPAGADDIERVCRELAGDASEEQVAFRAGVRHVARLVRRAPSKAGAAEAVAPRRERAVRLEIAERGVFDNLRLEPIERRAPGPGEVEIRIHAGGLNFRDVLNALGVYEGHPGPLGTECAGTIVAVGEGVDDLVVGQEVMAMTPGTFGTFVTAGADLVIPKPANVAADVAAGIPIAFLTADYALNHLARMSAGERVLIHAAAGGVGLAAVQLAKQAGAEIFATAGSPQKRAYLQSLGVTHVLNSRTLEFADEIMARTDGRGVDIVLNSLNGEWIPKSLSALAPGGRFVEIGKAGIWTAEQMAAARPDVVYHSVYMGTVERPLIRTILRRIGRAIEDGALQPLPTRRFALSDAASAFRFMAQARHTGKIVIADESVGARPSRHGRPLVAPDATYLVTGGLGSLGLLVAGRLAALGAKHLAIVSRREPAAAARATLDALAEQGVKVAVLRGDVASRADLDRVLAALDATMPPLRGIVHAAGVLDDGVLLQQRWERFGRVMAPKVAGTWHLHDATRDRPLDFFVMFSSIVSLFGGRGQANYAAANAFLDAMAHHRRAGGRAAMSINWGPWADGGMAASVDSRHQQRWEDRGMSAITGEQGLAILERLLRDDPPQPCVFGVDWPVFLAQYSAGGVPPLLRELAAGVEVTRRGPQAAAPRQQLRRDLEEAPPNRRRQIVMACVRDHAVKVLGISRTEPIEPGVPLSEIGLDSLMAVELRNALGAAVGRQLPATLLFKYPSLQALTDYLANEVLAIAEAETPAEAPAPPEPDADAAAIERLSDDEVRRLLEEEIRSLAQG